jgi:hypothetical protein
MRPYATALLVLVLAPAAARAQEQAPPAPAVEETQDEETLASRPHLQVLEHPYDISSFYRSSQQDGRGVDFGYRADSQAASRYPIAGFYRSGASGAYSQFWTTGYGYGYGNASATTRGRGLIGARRPRPLGLNGDLYLFAPFLAPVGPLTGVFFER